MRTVAGLHEAANARPSKREAPRSVTRIVAPDDLDDLEMLFDVVFPEVRVLDGVEAVPASQLTRHLAIMVCSRLYFLVLFRQARE